MKLEAMTVAVVGLGYVGLPLAVAYAQGGLYLIAYVPEYLEMRTFAIERLQEVSLLEERFTKARPAAVGTCSTCTAVAQQLGILQDLKQLSKRAGARCVGSTSRGLRLARPPASRHVTAQPDGHARPRNQNDKNETDF